jgi:hypothetical protein
MRISFVFAVACCVAFAESAAAQNLLANPGFESGLSSWTTVGPGWRIGVGADAHSGRNGAVCDVLPTQESTQQWRILYQNIAASPGEVFSASAWLRTVSLKASRSYFEIQFLNDSKDVIRQFDTRPVQSDGGYGRWQFETLAAPPKTAFISVRAVVNVERPSSSNEFHTWDDIELRRLSVTGADKAYLKTLAADTWRSIEALVEPVHGLPYDSSAHAATTSTTNIGFYMVSVVAAKELGFIDEAAAVAKLTPVLNAVKQLPKWHGFQATWTDVNTLKARIDANEHVVSLLDAGNYIASLIVVAQAIPALSKECNDLLDATDIGFFYDSATGRLHGGFDVNNNAFVPNWWVSDLATDSRLISFLAVGKGVPASSWSKLNRTRTATKGLSFYDPGWTGGGLFMQYISAMFIDERGATMGESAKNFALDQIFHACDVGSQVWGWSACDSSRYGYTNTYGMMPHDNVVAPYAAALAIDDWPAAVVNDFRGIEALGGRDGVHALGFYDSFDTALGKPSSSFLTLDQSMTLISLCNYLKQGRIRSIFRSPPIVKTAYALIADP